MNGTDMFYDLFRCLTEFEVNCNNSSGYGCTIEFRSYTEFPIELTVLESCEITNGAGFAPQAMTIKF